MSVRERRKHRRLEGQFEVHVLNTGDDRNISPWEAVVQAHALDVSMRGMRLKAMYDVPVGSFLSTIIYFRGHESIALCEVVWKKEVMGEYVYGVSLTEWTQLDGALEVALKTMDSHHSDRSASAAES